MQVILSPHMFLFHRISTWKNPPRYEMSLSEGEGRGYVPLREVFILTLRHVLILTADDTSTAQSFVTAGIRRVDAWMVGKIKVAPRLYTDGN
jgi:hypothetical protein